MPNRGNIYKTTSNPTKYFLVLYEEQTDEYLRQRKLTGSFFSDVNCTVPILSENGKLLKGICNDRNLTLIGFTD